jgi:phosphatidylglycerol:prolipoprotein diacylglycerol transferase
MAALGVLFALMLALRTARIVRIDPNKLWNLCIVALFAALVGSRLLLVVVNWTVLRVHPLWVLGLAMIHHPLVSAVAAALAVIVAIIYAQRQNLPIRATADALAAPLALGLAFEEIGALLAGSGFGTETRVPWAVSYSDPLAARWNGTPLGVLLQPVQAYAAFAFLAVSVCLVIWLPHRRQSGDIAGACLMATGAVVYFTEFWRDSEGRGAWLSGALDGPQVAAIALVLVGALMLRQRNSRGFANTAGPSTAKQPAPETTEATHE